MGTLVNSSEKLKGNAPSILTNSFGASVNLKLKMFNALLFCAVAGLTSGQLFPPTVPDLDVPKYLGQWYQMYASPIVMATFERDGHCQTAEYGVVNATMLSVHNSQRINSTTGPRDDIYGFAITTDEPGKLEVTLDGGSQAGAPYWIVKLGPVKEYNGVEQYSHAVVTDPFLVFLFVLVRDIEEFERDDEQEMLTWLDDFGFNSLINYPIKSIHDEQCTYPWSV